MVKKFFLFIMFFFMGIWYSSFASIDYIKNNFEYIDLWNSNIYIGQKYTSSKWNNYYFLWSFRWYYFDVNSSQNMLNFVNFVKSKWEGLFLFMKNKIFYIVFDENKNLNIIQKSCIKLHSPLQKKLLSYHYDILKISKNSIISDTIDTSLLTCAYDENYVWFNTNSFTLNDLPFLANNYKYIWTILDKFKKDESDFIKSVYAYILKSTSYDYSTVDDIDTNGSVDHTYPWQVATFFKWWKLVCDWYVKTLIFFMRYGWYDPERIVWKIQPIDTRFTSLGTYLHSWVKLGNKYYDPTFDDTIKNNKVSFVYFSKPLACFNLEHYTSWTIKFTSLEDRWIYIKNNLNILENQCPEILSNVLISDGKTLDYIKVIFSRYGVKDIQYRLCNMFNICIDNISTKKELLDRLSVYKLYFTKGETSITVDFSALKNENILYSKIDVKEPQGKTAILNSNLAYNDIVFTSQEKVYLLKNLKKYKYLKEKLDKIFDKKIKPYILSHNDKWILKYKILKNIDNLIKNKYADNQLYKTILLYFKYKLLIWK